MSCNVCMPNRRTPGHETTQHIRVNIHIHTYTYIRCTHTHTHTYIYKNTGTRNDAAHPSRHTYTYIHIHIHTYTDTYIHTVHTNCENSVLYCKKSRTCEAPTNSAVSSVIVSLHMSVFLASDKVVFSYANYTEALYLPSRIALTCCAVNVSEVCSFTLTRCATATRSLCLMRWGIKDASFCMVPANESLLFVWGIQLIRRFLNFESSAVCCKTTRTCEACQRIQRCQV